MLVPIFLSFKFASILLHALPPGVVYTVSEVQFPEGVCCLSYLKINVFTVCSRFLGQLCWMNLLVIVGFAAICPRKCTRIFYFIVRDENGSKIILSTQRL